MLTETKAPQGLMSFDEWFQRGGEPFDTAGHAPPRINLACLCYHRGRTECPPEFECITYLEADIENARRNSERLERGYADLYPEDGCHGSGLEVCGPCAEGKR